jgi:prepilin-type N-terminal cleavage/methylation domain-containing protein
MMDMRSIQPPCTRRGFSLLEMAVAMVIFVAVLSAVLEFTLTTKQIGSLGEAEDDLNAEAVRVLQTIGTDISQSGWHFPDVATVNVLADTFAGDRTQRYYPYVIQQDDDTGTAGNDEGLGGAFPHVTRSGDMVFIPIVPITATKEPLPGTPGDAATHFHPLSPGEAALYRDSYYARSQELIFLRQVGNGWVQNPREYQAPTLNFGDIDQYKIADNHANIGVAFPNGWIEVRNLAGKIISYDRRPPPPLTAPDNERVGFAWKSGTLVPELYGIPVENGRLVYEEGEVRIDPVWETVDAPDYLPMEANTDQPIPSADVPREFMYSVIPSAVGLGRLVRAYSVTDVSGFPYGTGPGDRITPAAIGAGMVIDQVLSEHVVRVVFDTYRTVDDLEINEIRVRLYLARRQTSHHSLILHRTVESILTMRGKCTSEDKGIARCHLEFDY